MNDPISDMLTRIRNASRALLPEVAMPHSRIKAGIASILKQEGYIAECVVDGAKLKTLKLRLKFKGRKGIIDGLRRVSRPGLRRYVSASEMPRVRSGMGIAIVSTSKGVMTGQEARKQNLGGELICFVW